MVACKAGLRGLQIGPARQAARAARALP
jgi:hypothetical protein